MMSKKISILLIAVITVITTTTPTAMAISGSSFAGEQTSLRCYENNFQSQSVDLVASEPDDGSPPTDVIRNILQEVTPHRYDYTFINVGTYYHQCNYTDTEVGHYFEVTQNPNGFRSILTVGTLICGYSELPELNYGTVVDGRSSSVIFTPTTDTQTNSQPISVTFNATDWTVDDRVVMNKEQTSVNGTSLVDGLKVYNITEDTVYNFKTTLNFISDNARDYSIGKEITQQITTIQICE